MGGGTQGPLIGHGQSAASAKLSDVVREHGRTLKQGVMEETRGSVRWGEQQGKVTQLEKKDCLLEDERS